jgi:glycosyltransferase involved in cell wall biosynthesis
VNVAKPVCSIIIRCYNEEKHIRRLLEGIIHQTIRDVEIILIDSGSSDETLSIAGQFPVKIVKILPQDFTFGRSLNLGVQNANSDLLVFVSAHVYPVYPDWLEKLLAQFYDPSIALNYGKQRGGTGSKFSEQQIFAHWYPTDTQQYQDIPFCNNANAAVRRGLALEHPYNETLPGLEDLEWSQWSMSQGYAIHYCPEAEIVHVHEESPRGVYNRYKREAMAYKAIYIQERFGFIDFLRISTRNIIADFSQAAKQGVLMRNLISILWFRVMQFWGTYQGYRHHGPLTWQLRQTFYYPHGIDRGTSKLDRDVEPIKYQDLG